jgi:formylglycine-generating enzyme required for sulfatase activity
MGFPRSTLKKSTLGFYCRLFVVLPFLRLSSALAAEPGMVFIPAGEFLRGRSHALPDDDQKWFPTLLKDDRPVRKLFINAFYLDEYEVTNDQYAAFVKASKHRTPYNWPRRQLPKDKGRLPVVDVSWDDAADYCRWAGKRLPTEAEWERACRGLVEGAIYPWGNGAPAKGDTRFDRLDGPGEVRRAKPNYFGLFDMAGNVWEWCADWYAIDYYQTAPERNPPGPQNGLYRVLRGGSWADEPKYLTCAYRSWARPAERSPNIGFRCAKGFRTAE